MRPVDLFRFCPRCGAKPITEPGINPLRCEQCQLVYFFNPTVAAAAFIFDGTNRALFIRRAHEPAQGKLAVPGGFIDYGESAEVALLREVREEVGIEIDQLQYLGSWTNQYVYREVTYPVVDLIFRARAVNAEAAQSLDAVAGFEWRKLNEIDPNELAFPSIRGGWELLQIHLK